MTTFVLAQRDPMNEKSTYPRYNSKVFFRSGELLNNILTCWTQFFLLLKAYISPQRYRISRQ